MNIQQIKSFIENNSWILDLIQIVLYVIAVSAALYGGIKLLDKPTSWAKFYKKHLSKTASPDIEKIAHVAVVDDHPEDFPLDQLDNFKIESIPSVKVSGFNDLVKFDFIFLDMHGIVPDDPEQGGLKLIEYLRKSNPIQRICAVSSKGFDPTATDFFILANIRKRKPLTALECREAIIGQLQEKFDAEAICKRLDGLFKDYSIIERIKTIAKLEAFAKTTQKPTNFSIGINKKSEVNFLLQDLIKLTRHLKR